MKGKLKGAHSWWKVAQFILLSEHSTQIQGFLISKSFQCCCFSSDIVEVSLISFQEEKIARLEIEGSKVWKGWAGHKGSKYFWFLSLQYCRPGEMPSIKYQGSEKQNLRTLKPRDLRNVHLSFWATIPKVCQHWVFLTFSLRSEYTR